MSETDYIGVCLSTARRVARKYDISFWIVAHPMKPKKNPKGGFDRPTLYDINGSANWFNKIDNGFVVHRTDKTGLLCTVHVDKIKNKHYGRLGEVELEFIPQSGRFKQPGPQKKETNGNAF